MNQFETFLNLPEGSYENNAYIKEIIEIANLAEEHEFNGLLLHHNLQMVDPFVLASYILNCTKRISPIIAIQPNYINPLTTAKMIQSLTYIYKRKIYLNMITGSARYEFQQIHDEAEHSKRYRRLDDYIVALKRLFTTSNELIEIKSEFYNFQKLTLSPTVVDSQLLPELLIAGASEDARSVAMKHEEYIITHPQPINSYREMFGIGFKKKAIKIGVIARETNKKAWSVAMERYEPTIEGKLALRLKKGSESNWLRILAELGSEQELYDEVYWMGGFNSGKVNNPVLVGSIDQVTNYLRLYLEAGVGAIIYSGLRDKEDFKSVKEITVALRED